MTTEVWRAVVGYEGCYEVSDKGRVRSITRILTSGKLRKGCLRKLRPNAVSGYYEVMLSWANELSMKRVHLLVLEAFKPPRPTGMEGCHRNGQKADNSGENLRWGSKASNQEDKEKHGTVLRGNSHPNARINDVDAERARDIRAVTGAEYSCIGAYLGMSALNVGKIVRGERWKS